MNGFRLAPGTFARRREKKAEPPAVLTSPRAVRLGWDGTMIDTPDPLKVIHAAPVFAAKRRGYEARQRGALEALKTRWKSMPNHLQLALEVDGITHEEEKAISEDKERQNELEKSGVSFLRFDALLVVNKVEAAIREIERWILTYEERNRVPDFVKRKRNKINPPQLFKEKSGSISPLRGGEAV